MEQKARFLVKLHIVRFNFLIRVATTTRRLGTNRSFFYLDIEVAFLFVQVAFFFLCEFWKYTRSLVRDLHLWFERYELSTLQSVVRINTSSNRSFEKMKTLRIGWSWYYSKIKTLFLYNKVGVRMTIQVTTSDPHNSWKMCSGIKPFT